MFDAIWSVVGPIVGVLAIISFFILIGGFGFILFFLLYSANRPIQLPPKDKQHSQLTELAWCQQNGSESVIVLIIRVIK